MSEMTRELDGVEEFRPIQGLDRSIARLFVLVYGNIRVLEEDGQPEAIVSGSGKQPEIRLNDVYGAPERASCQLRAENGYSLRPYRHRIIL